MFSSVSINTGFEPCPFCGCSEILIKEHFTTYHGTFLYAQCNHCFSRTDSVFAGMGNSNDVEKNRARAIEDLKELWNIRTPVEYLHRNRKSKINREFNPLGGNIPVDEICSQDMEFLASIITQICKYAVKNEMLPTETIKTVANNLLLLTEISNYDNWKCSDKE